MRTLAGGRGFVGIVLLALRSDVDRKVVVNERALSLAVGVLEDDDGVVVDVAVQVASVLVEALVRCSGFKEIKIDKQPRGVPIMAPSMVTTRCRPLLNSERFFVLTS